MLFDPTLTHHGLGLGLGLEYTMHGPLIVLGVWKIGIRAEYSMFRLQLRLDDIRTHTRR